ncbi:low density lipoprotein receptor adapter protein 1-B-like isoform X2 [Hylaeus anthracinus]|uniref:low density lipoprotein receptor adapter protein 1-B-like isoform X2 n=1 Tax=Hylaeus volcanicus TaxID=313075 RepID=UPI0023B81D2E|nr:low density lipoprotein receptor adapter protein 1-B-like isoform X2 [Hylaeus volcanicus]XP_054008237.1 low density lipoprotein receptor adapter protein 1-B-like isoform X2 [Hylaeus anthracinus]
MPFFKKLRRFSRHKKLCEEWALANSRECVEGGGSAGTTQEESEDASEARFTLKYLGSTLVETPSSEEATAEAIKTVITMAKASGKKLQRVSLAVSLKGIRMTDLATEEDQLQVSIYRISYCSADATHDHVFAFIATNLNETMECHAFLCPKRKMAQTVTLTVAQAFNTAYEAWQLSQADPRIHHAQDKSPSLTDDRSENGEKEKKDEDAKSVDKVNEQNKRSDQRCNANDSQKNLLIDLSNETNKSAGNSWVCFEEETGSDGKKIPKKSATSIPMTTLRHTTTPTSHHVVPRPTTGFKMQNAWGESRSVDLMCS